MTLPSGPGERMERRGRGLFWTPVVRIPLLRVYFLAALPVIWPRPPRPGALGGNFSQVELVQLDDLGGAMRERLKAAAFLILATSVGNHQAWVAVPECAADFARRLRQGSGADPS